MVLAGDFVVGLRADLCTLDIIDFAEAGERSTNRVRLPAERLHQFRDGRAARDETDDRCVRANERCAWLDVADAADGRLGGGGFARCLVGFGDDRRRRGIFKAELAIDLGDGKLFESGLLGGAARVADVAVGCHFDAPVWEAGCFAKRWPAALPKLHACSDAVTVEK